MRAPCAKTPDSTNNSSTASHGANVKPPRRPGSHTVDAIAWSVLVLEVTRLIVIAIAAVVWEPGRLGGFSFVPWLAVLLLFVLSGVFAHGARMRADLEGTV